MIGVPNFESLDVDPDEMLAAVANHYKQPLPKLLNRRSRLVAAEKLWTDLDFRNLSVDILSQIWSTTLVDKGTRKRLGIQRTPRTIVRYMVERVPFAMSGDESGIVFEPCCGSASFLIGAMNRLRPRLFGMSSEERHSYFVQHLAGIEKDPFGLEISKLALTLADFPNPDGRDIQQGDVFVDGSMTAYLRRARVVLCNPPFEGFEKDQRKGRRLAATKPAELLNRILADLHPSGIIGFVLPRLFVDGGAFAPLRQRLVERFIVASDPIPHSNSRVFVRKVNDDAASWERFERRYEFSAEHITSLSQTQAVLEFPSPELPELWTFLNGYPTLENVVNRMSRVSWFSVKRKEDVPR